MYQALPLLSGESLGTRLTGSYNIRMFTCSLRSCSGFYFLVSHLHWWCNQWSILSWHLHCFVCRWYSFLKKLYPQGRSQTSVNQSWTVKHAFTSFILAYFGLSISPKHGSALNTRNDSMVARSMHAMILYVGILNVWRHVSGKLTSGVAVRGDSGVAGEQRVVVYQSFIPGVSTPYH